MFIVYGDLIDSERMPDDSGITLYVRMSRDAPPIKGTNKQIYSCGEMEREHNAQNM